MLGSILAINASGAKIIKIIIRACLAAKIIITTIAAKIKPTRAGSNNHKAAVTTPPVASRTTALPAIAATPAADPDKIDCDRLAQLPKVS